MDAPSTPTSCATDSSSPPNARVKLDDPDWQQRLLESGTTIRPRAFIFDPLARMKDAGREENDQTGMAPVIEYLRLLRDETQAAPLFVHHTGHQREHMRGSSDLESVWESRLAFKRDGENGVVTVKAEHRDEESGATVVYTLDWHHDTRTMRLRPTVPPLAERILNDLRDNGPSRSEEIAKRIETRRSATREVTPLAGLVSPRLSGSPGTPARTRSYTRPSRTRPTYSASSTTRNLLKLGTALRCKTPAGG